jgi:hypothetical protein
VTLSGSGVVAGVAGTARGEDATTPGLVPGPVGGEEQPTTSAASAAASRFGRVLRRTTGNSG